MNKFMEYNSSSERWNKFYEIRGRLVREFGDYELNNTNFTIDDFSHYMKINMRDAVAYELNTGEFYYGTYYYGGYKFNGDRKLKGWVK